MYQIPSKIRIVKFPECLAAITFFGVDGFRFVNEATDTTGCEAWIPDCIVRMKSPEWECIPILENETA